MRNIIIVLFYVISFLFLNCTGNNGVPSRENAKSISHYNMNQSNQNLIDLTKAHSGKIYQAGKVQTVMGEALFLDGDNDYVDLGDWFNYQNFTICLWLRTEKNQMEYANIIDNNHTSYKSFNLQQKQNHINRYGFGVHTLKYGAVNVEFDLTPGKWTHLVLIKKDSTILLYKDAELIGKNTVPGDGYFYYDGTQNLYIGRWGGGGRNWHGTIKEMRIYNTALNDDTIYSLYSEYSSLIPANK